MDTNIDAAQLLSQVMTQAPASRRDKTDPQRLKETAQQFEAIFIQQMFKEMRRNIPNEGLIPRGNADDIYAQLLDFEAAKITAQQGGIGLTKLIMQQLSKE